MKYVIVIPDTHRGKPYLRYFKGTVNQLPEFTLHINEATVIRGFAEARKTAKIISEYAPQIHRIGTK
jgi:hypothetical protein